jgi:hypothetical protein
MAEISIGDIVGRLLGDTEHPADGMPLPLMCLSLWALRTLHASLAGPGVWHDYPRMPSEAAMTHRLQQLHALEERHR